VTIVITFSKRHLVQSVIQRLLASYYGGIVDLIIYDTMWHPFPMDSNQSYQFELSIA